MDNNKSYIKLFYSSLVSFVLMYMIMYVMVATFDHIYLNINKFYMAILMVAPMVILKIVFMPSMFKNVRKNISIIGVSLILIIFSFFMIRTQGFVYDKQFLRSMIPHHSSAILMCEQASIKDPEIKELCVNIVNTQQQEIDQMKQIYERLK